MNEIITVEVFGPRLLAQGIRAVLSELPDLRVLKGAVNDGESGYMSPPNHVRLFVLVPCPDKPADIVRESPTRGLDSPAFFYFSAGIRRPPKPLPLSLRRTAILFSGSEGDITAACERGIEVFLSANDDLSTVHHGILAAAHSQSFCSPHLTGLLVQALRIRALTREEVEERPTTGPLSSRERQVADLAAAGLSNEEIGARLFVGVSTVKAHLREVFVKLAIQRRSQIQLRFEDPARVVL